MQLMMKSSKLLSNWYRTPSPESVVPLTKLMNGANVILPTKSDTRAKGYYVVVDFQADPAEIKELDRVIKIHEEIIRHIIVKQDD